ncbi:MAG: HD domain-containing protein, partial [Nitrososphaerota archaeon]|nr:HD domain-containing protein [Nitrososphaerota archaeon]
GEYLQCLISEFSGKYELTSPLGAGGSGIVFQARNLRVPENLAVKFSRPMEDEDARQMIYNEYEILPKFDHPGVIRIVDRGRIDVRPELVYLIEPLIRNPLSISERLTKLLEPLANMRKPETGVEAFDTEIGAPQEMGILDEILQKLTEIVRQWVDALEYVHSCGYIYLDAKPSNAVVDEHEKLYMIDFGTALRSLPNRESNPKSTELESETITKKEPPLEGDEYVNAFFTKKYAHPELRNRETHATSSDRVKAEGVPRSFLEFRFDYYALGMSILELIGAMNNERPNDAPTLSLFRSLHLIATRLLDGQNADTPEKTFRPKKEIKLPQTFGDLKSEDYRSLKYDDLQQVREDLDKELGVWNLEKRVPELDTFSKEVVRVVPDINTVLTRRLVRIIEHPLFGRLKNVSQLGLVSLVYPTADHSRFDHVLGTYTYVASYVKGLFNDLQNPLFRNLVTERDIKAILLAGLLHDLGQYPLAHDLGEVNRRIFGHERLSVELLDDPTTDSDKKTLAEIIMDKETGWGLDLAEVKAILDAHSQASAENKIGQFKAQLLSALIDGPIDADKIDYITRDTSQCRIPYGNQLDFDRLLRVISVAVVPKDVSDYRVTIGVYEKGRASAEAVNLARYLMFSSVYWHHTSRVLKTMLHYAVAAALPSEVFQEYEETQTKKIGKDLSLFVTGLTTRNIPASKVSGKASKRSDKISLDQPVTSEVLDAAVSYKIGKELPNIDAKDFNPEMGFGDYHMLNWLKSSLPKPNLTTSRLIDSIITRKLYKRLVTFDRTDPKEEAFIKQFDKLDWAAKLILCRRFQVSLADEVKSCYDDSVTKSMPRIEEVERLLNLDLAILIDVPNPSQKNPRKARPLMIVPELKEKVYLQETSKPVLAVDWTPRMMDSIAPLRVLCHPRLRLIVSGTIPSLRATVKDLLDSSLP